MKKFCSQCGSPAEGRFCPNCGAPVNCDASEIKQEREKPSYERPVHAAESSAVTPKRIFAIVMAVFFVIRAVACIVGMYKTGSELFIYFGNIELSVIALFFVGGVGCILRVAGCIAMAYALFLVYNDVNENHAESQFYAVILAAFILLAGRLLGYIGIIYLTGFVSERILLLIAIIGMIVFSFMENRAFIRNFNISEFGNNLKNAFSYITNESEKVESTFEDIAEERGLQMTNPQMSPDGYIKLTRTPGKLIVLGILTCGIYTLLVWYGLIKDVNKACRQDGKHTAGLLKYIILTILTCGFYGLFWGYALANRLQENGCKRGIMITENGTTFLLWQIIGSLICGLGPLVAYIQLINNCNRIFDCYNRENGYVQ